MKTLKKKMYTRAMALCLALSLALTPALGVGVSAANNTAVSEITSRAESTKTKTVTLPVLKTSGILSVIKLYGKDVFKVTYVPSTGKITKVATSKKVANPLGVNFLEYGSMSRTSKTTKVWTFASTWYLNTDVIPEAIESVVESKIPLIAALTGLGRVATIRATYTVKGDGTVTQNKIQYKLMVPSNLKATVKKLLSLLLKKKS